MKKLVKYFLISTAVFLVTATIVCLFYFPAVCRTLANIVINNEDSLPLPIVKIANKITGHSATPTPTPEKLEETIQIIEGWNNRDISRYFERQNKWTNDAFLAVTGWPQIDYRYNKKLPPLPDFSQKFSFLADKPKYYGLEGYLFPDTYRIYASSTAAEVVEKMLTNFDVKLTSQMRADIKKQGKTIYEIVTMASIIEKEAPIDYQPEGDRNARIISGIFWDRLKIGQALQSDATLSYIFDDEDPQHSGTELEVDSPYNTYKYRDLPPGPICNPGLIAIKAAIYPIKTDYNYFLTPKGKDQVIYAKTYEEHLQNKYRYLR